MRIPLTRYGLRELLLYGGGGAVLFVALLLLGPPFSYASPLPALAALFVLSFFRDPERKLPGGEEVVVAPADGKVVSITDMEDEEFLESPAKRIDIFLALYNVHVNRSPLAGEVRYVVDRDGQFLNAMDLTAGERNQARSLGFVADRGGFRYLVRQIVGVAARRIVTSVGSGDRLARGQRFGMLKFGSRTQLSIPADVPFTLAVSVGDRVKGGETPIGTIGGEAAE